MPARPAPQGPWALHVLPPGISLRLGFPEEGRPQMDIDRRRLLATGSCAFLTGVTRPAWSIPNTLAIGQCHPLTRSLLERARKIGRGHRVPDRAMAELTIRQFADASGWTKPLVIKWMNTPTDAFDHLSRFGLEALLDMGTTGFWRRDNPPAPRDDETFDRAFEARLIANGFLGVDDHDRMLMVPKLRAKSRAISANQSDAEVFRVRAVSAQIGWLETSMAEVAAHAVANVELLLSIGVSTDSVAINNQFRVFESYEHGLLTTWETPDALICVPRFRIQAACREHETIPEWGSGIVFFEDALGRVGDACRTEQIWPKRVISHAQKQTSHRPDENATSRARLDNADTSFAYDANDRKKDEVDATTKSKTDEDRSCQGREGENNAAQLFTETAGGFEGLASGIDFPIQSAKVRQSFHGQAVFVLFAIGVLLHKVLRKPFARPLGLGTVCKSAIYAQRAIDG